MIAPARALPCAGRRHQLRLLPGPHGGFGATGELRAAVIAPAVRLDREAAARGQEAGQIQPGAVW